MNRIINHNFYQTLIFLKIERSFFAFKCGQCFLYIIKITVQDWLLTAVEAHIVEPKIQSWKIFIYHILGFPNLSGL